MASYLPEESLSRVNFESTKIYLLGKAAFLHCHCLWIHGQGIWEMAPLILWCHLFVLDGKHSWQTWGCAFHWVSDKPWAKSKLPALCSVVWDLLTLWGALTLTCPLIYDFYWVFCEVVNWTTLQLVWALIRKLSSKWITFSVAAPLLKFIAKAGMFSATCL